ncbi:MAG TPA: glycosyltransferase family 4 protein [Gaiellaceae bacterium]|nr:glycosyltransferase family 4 protein [Gaiellaceae bacterium]
MSHRLLFLVPFVPRFDARHGGGRTVASLIRRLGERHEIALVCLRGEREPGPDIILQSRCEIIEEVALPQGSSSPFLERVARPLKLVGASPDRVVRTRTASYAELARAVAEAFRPDVLQIECVEMAQYLPALAEVRASRVLVDHDPGLSAATDYSLLAGGLRRFSRRLDAIAWERFSRHAFAAVDRLVVFTDRDRESLAPLAGDTRIETIPLSVELPSRPLDPRGAEPPTVLFFGDYLHAPNSDAADRLMGTIMPRVRRSHPDARLELVGAHPTPTMVSDSGDGVAVRGPVESVTPYLDRAAVVAAPLRLGGGMRVKVLETLAAGKALVASSRAVEGLELSSGEHAIVTDDDDEFAEAVSSLLADEERRVALASAARRWAQDELRWEPSVAAYEGLYGELLADRE